MGRFSTSLLQSDELLSEIFEEFRLWQVRSVGSSKPCPFKASSATFNTLLRILNEQTFDNGNGNPTKVPPKMCLAASNEWPNNQEGGKGLGALFDRFLMRERLFGLSSSEQVASVCCGRGITSPSSPRRSPPKKSTKPTTKQCPCLGRATPRKPSDRSFARLLRKASNQENNGDTNQ